MPIDIVCPECSATIRTSDDRGGKQVRCAGCGEVVRVPTHRTRRSLGGAEERADKPVVLIAASVVCAAVVGWLGYMLVSKREANRQADQPQPAPPPSVIRTTGEAKFDFLAQLDSASVGLFDPPRNAFWVTHGILTEPAKAGWTQVVRRYSVPDFTLAAEYRVSRTLGSMVILGDQLLAAEWVDSNQRGGRPPGVVAYDLKNLPRYDPKKERPDLDPVARVAVSAGGLWADPDDKWVYTSAASNEPRDPTQPASKTHFYRLPADLTGPSEVMTLWNGMWHPSTLSPRGDVTVGHEPVERPPAWVNEYPPQWWTQRKLHGLESNLTTARIRLPDRGFAVSRGDWNLHELAWSPDRVVGTTPLSVGGGQIGGITLARGGKYLFAVNNSPDYLQVLRVDTPLPDGATRTVCDDIELPRTRNGQPHGGVVVSPDGSFVVLGSGLVYTVRYLRE